MRNKWSNRRDGYEVMHFGSAEIQFKRRYLGRKQSNTMQKTNRCQSGEGKQQWRNHCHKNGIKPFTTSKLLTRWSLPCSIGSINSPPKHTSSTLTRRASVSCTWLGFFLHKKHARFSVGITFADFSSMHNLCTISMLAQTCEQFWNHCEPRRLH